MILPSLTVTRTWALPYWVGIASPVAVPDAVDADRSTEWWRVAVAGGSGAAVAATAAVRLGWCALKPSEAAKPTAVAVEDDGCAAHSERERLVVDVGGGHAGRAQGGFDGASVKPSGPQM